MMFVFYKFQRPLMSLWSIRAIRRWWWDHKEISARCIRSRLVLLYQVHRIWHHQTKIESDTRWRCRLWRKQQASWMAKNNTM